MKKGFTLIELLVVIAIIGILASVVVASLNSARTKGQEAAIKSNLKNMIPQAELLYDAASPNSYVTTCAGVTNMITAINSAGGTAVCYSFDNTRWGVSAKFNSNTAKNWAVDSDGVVTWDASDASGSTMNWDTAVSTCGTLGGRLPSFEELKALYNVYGINPTPGFQAFAYWSGTGVPGGAGAYRVDMGGGTTSGAAKTSLFYARCVR